jgi:polysaccharide biosynthesis transport protein
MDHFITLLRTLWRNKWQLIGIPTFTMVLIGYFTADQPQRFKTEARLYLNLQENKGLSLSDEDLKQYQVHTYFQNTIELLKSKKVIERVRLKVIERALDNTDFFKAGNEELLQNKALVLKRLANLAEQHESLLETQEVDRVMMRYLESKGLSIARLKDMIVSFRILDSNFMKVELTDDAAEKVQQLAWLFIQCLMEENRSLAKSKIKGHKDIIEELVRQAKADLETRIKKLEKFKADNSIINLGEHTKAIVVYLVQLEGTRANLLAKVAAGHKGKTEVLNAVHSGNDITLDLSNHQEVLDLKQQLRSMYRQTIQASLEKQTVPQMELINGQIEAKKEEIMVKLSELSRKTPYDPSQVQLDLVDRYLNYDLDAETSMDMVTIINNEIQRVMNYSKRFAPFESTIGAYERDISTAQNVYITLLNKLSLTETLEFGSGENVVAVVDPPYLPVKPESSKRPILIASGGLAVLILMIGGLVLVQLLDSSISSVEKFERVSRLPVQAALPDLADARKKGLEEGAGWIRQKQILQLSNHILATANHSVFMLTSNQRGEGKHHLASEVLSVLQNSGKKIAVIDADWTEEKSCPEFYIMKELVGQNGFIRNQQQITAQLNALRDANDVVLIVSSPIHLCADLPLWASYCDQLLLLVKGNRVYTKADLRAEATLKSFGRPVSVVLSYLHIENMEDFLGEIPRHRSFVRKFIKKILTRNFEWFFSK